MLAPVEFGSVFALDFDGITSAYDCTGHSVHVSPYDEQAAWRRLSSEKFHGHLVEQRRNAKKQAALPTPEEAIRAEENLRAQALAEAPDGD
jgi:hypothetical protein